MAALKWADAPVTDVMTRHLDEPVVATIRDWFGGRIVAERLDGNRSVLLKHPLDDRKRIKIKGAGLNGKSVRWNEYRASGPQHPSFDFDGRMTVDAAFGHDNAIAGGASFQQAATEWRATAELIAADEDVVPCLGYGSITNGAHRSWFCVMEMGADWTEAVPPEGFDPEEWRELVTGHGRNAARIAKDFGLIGYFWHMATPDGRYPVKDVHPFRRADPLAMSAISWVLAVYYGIHIRCNQIEFAGIRRWDIGLPQEAIVWPLISLCPDVTLADHAALRTRIVAPYIVARPDPFDSKELWRRLCDNKVTAALIDLCPPEFARP